MGNIPLEKQECPQGNEELGGVHEPQHSLAGGLAPPPPQLVSLVLGTVLQLH